MATSPQIGPVKESVAFHECGHFVEVLAKPIPHEPECVGLRFVGQLGHFSHVRDRHAECLLCQFIELRRALSRGPAMDMTLATAFGWR